MLCVQPRRMAVVAVATRVAEGLDVSLGKLVVGYHIGSVKNAFLNKAELLFVTASIFLKQLKCHEAASLAPYGAVVIDEVHERSCEDDLALACLCQLVRKSRELQELKIVLMSATADIRKYYEYAKPLGDVGVYAIDDGATVYNTATK